MMWLKQWLLLYFVDSGRIKFYTHPPDQQSLPTHISAEIVKEWGAAFDLVRDWLTNVAGSEMSGVVVYTESTGG